MKRNTFSTPPAHELLTRPKSHGGWYRMPDPAADPHPVEVALCGVSGSSLLTVVACVFFWLLQSLSSDPDYEFAGKVSDVMWISLLVFLASTGLYLVWSRFVRHG